MNAQEFARIRRYQQVFVAFSLLTDVCNDYHELVLNVAEANLREWLEEERKFFEKTVKP